jgi:hypothetical protein
MFVPHTAQQLQVLVKLYSVKKIGTLKEITNMCKSFLPVKECGIVYRMKPFLVQYGILEEAKQFTFSDKQKVIYYKINHREIDRFLFTETFLRDIYDRRIRTDSLLTVRPLKQKEWEHDGV